MSDKTLLLVDDEENLLLALKRIFEDDDYRILTATNCRDALKLLADNAIQVIICDQRMPEMTGSELFTEIKKSYPKTIRILLSGYTDFEALKNAINEGDVYKFINKPWDNDVLLTTVHEAFQIHEQKNMSKEMIDAKIESEVKRLQEEFLGNISHEIRTPLNGILGFSEILNSGAVDPLSPEHKEYLGDILESSQLLSKLLINALDLLQSDPAQADLQPVTIDLNRLMSEVIAIHHESAMKLALTVEIKIDPTMKAIVLDPARLKQVISQYLSNAIKFSKAHGKIEITAKPESETQFRIEVRDGGTGIADADQQKIFKPFKQLDMSAGKKYQGAGLGLASAKRIVEMQGGEVGMTSEVGKGSVFYAILPYVQNSHG